MRDDCVATPMQDRKRKFSGYFADTPGTSYAKVRITGDVKPCEVRLDRLTASTMEELTEDERDIEMVVSEPDSVNEPAVKLQQSRKNGAPKYTLADAKASKICETDISDVEQVVNNSHFCPIKLIGEGNFGKVVVARKTGGIDDGKVYALKYLSKDTCMQWNDLKNTISERKVLEKLVGLNFFCQMQYAFKTKNSLVYVLDFASGGELFGHMFLERNRNGLRIDQLRFWTAQIVLALDTMHSMGIIYRDLKLENVLIDADGNVLLADFGLAQMLQKPYQAFGYGGTLPYIAPEIFSYLHWPNEENGYTFAVDWWSFGVLTYEIATNTTPFGINSETDTAVTAEMKALNGSCKLKMKDMAKATGSADLGNLLKGLLIWNPVTRLNVNGIKKHPFYQGIDWDKLSRKQIPPIWTPRQMDPTNDADILTNVDEEFKQKPMPSCVSEPTNNPNGAPDLFQGFSYTAPALKYGPISNFSELVHELDDMNDMDTEPDVSVISIATMADDEDIYQLYAPKMPAVYLPLNAHQVINNDINVTDAANKIKSNIGEKLIIMPNATSSIATKSISELILGKIRKNPMAIEQKKRTQREIKEAEREQKAQLAMNCRRSNRLANKTPIKYERMC